MEADPNPAIRYRLRPTARVRWHGREYRIDAQGLRGAETAPVLFVGDSHLFGLATGETETLPALLGARNGGTPGYDLFQEAAWILAREEDLDPDTIVWFLNWGDLDPSSQGLEMTPRSAPLRPFLSLCVVRKAARVAGIEGALLAAPPPRPSDPWAAAETAIAAVSARGRMRGWNLTIVLLPAPYDWRDYPGRDAHARFARIGTKGNVPVIDLLDELKEEEPGPYRAEDAGHANARGNRRYAAAVAARLGYDPPR